MTPGSTVMYYRNGWRYGELVAVKGKLAVIRPYGPAKHKIQVPLTDVKEAK